MKNPDRVQVISITFLATVYNQRGKPRFNVPWQAVRLLKRRPKATVHLHATNVGSGEQFNFPAKMKSRTEVYGEDVPDGIRPGDKVLVTVSKASN